MTLYERYNTGENDHQLCDGSGWCAQRITIGSTGTNENFTLTSIKLRLFRSGTVSTVTCYLYAVDTSTHKPTGSPLATGTINGNDCTTSSAGAYYEFTMDSSYTCVASTHYAIVLKSEGAIYWKCVWASGSYTDGEFQVSSTEGVVWVLYTAADFMFEVYGTPAATGTNFQINVGDAWKSVTDISVNVGDAWKPVTSALINVGDTWKTIF